MQTARTELNRICNALLLELPEGLVNTIRSSMEKVIAARDNEVLGSIHVKMGHGTFGSPAVIMQSDIFPNWGYTVNVPGCNFKEQQGE